GNVLGIVTDSIAIGVTVRVGSGRRAEVLLFPIVRYSVAIRIDVGRETAHVDRRFFRPRIRGVESGGAIHKRHTDDMSHPVAVGGKITPEIHLGILIAVPLRRIWWNRIETTLEGDVAVREEQIRDRI